MSEKGKVEKVEGIDLDPNREGEVPFELMSLQEQVTQVNDLVSEEMRVLKSKDKEVSAATEALTGTPKLGPDIAPKNAALSAEGQRLKDEASEKIKALENALAELQGASQRITEVLKKKNSTSNRKTLESKQHIIKEKIDGIKTEISQHGQTGEEVNAEALPDTVLTQQDVAPASPDSQGNKPLITPEQITQDTSADTLIAPDTIETPDLIKPEKVANPDKVEKKPSISLAGLEVYRNQVISLETQLIKAKGGEKIRLEADLLKSKELYETNRADYVGDNAVRMLDERLALEDGRVKNIVEKRGFFGGIGKKAYDVMKKLGDMNLEKFVASKTSSKILRGIGKAASVRTAIGLALGGAALWAGGGAAAVGALTARRIFSGAGASVASFDAMQRFSDRSLMDATPASVKGMTTSEVFRKMEAIEAKARLSGDPKLLAGNQAYDALRGGLLEKLKSEGGKSLLEHYSREADENIANLIQKRKDKKNLHIGASLAIGTIVGSGALAWSVRRMLGMSEVADGVSDAAQEVATAKAEAVAKAGTKVAKSAVQTSVEAAPPNSANLPPPGEPGSDAALKQEIISKAKIDAQPLGDTKGLIRALTGESGAETSAALKQEILSKAKIDAQPLGDTRVLRSILSGGTDVEPLPEKMPGDSLLPAEGKIDPAGMTEGPNADLGSVEEPPIAEVASNHTPDISYEGGSAHFTYDSSGAVKNLVLEGGDLYPPEAEMEKMFKKGWFEAIQRSTMGSLDIGIAQDDFRQQMSGIRSMAMAEKALIAAGKGATDEAQYLREQMVTDMKVLESDYGKVVDNIYARDLISNTAEGRKILQGIVPPPESPGVTSVTARPKFEASAADSSAYESKTVTPATVQETTVVSQTFETDLSKVRAMPMPPEVTVDTTQATAAPEKPAGLFKSIGKWFKGIGKDGAAAVKGIPGRMGDNITNRMEESQIRMDANAPIAEKNYWDKFAGKGPGAGPPEIPKK